MPQHIIVCEGRSEFVYLQRLQSFLDSQTGDWNVPLRFIPQLPIGSDGSEQGGGFYNVVVKFYKAQHRSNPRSPIAVWVVDDIYVRQDSARERKNRASYLKKPDGIPDFVFSFHNFEDFLVLHMDDTALQRWHTAFDPAHVAHPLHSEDYLRLYEVILPGYRKGDLSPDFITRDSLLRLKTNLASPLVPASADPRFRSFAQFLIDQIDTAFPDLLVPYATISLSRVSVPVSVLKR